MFKVIVALFLISVTSPLTSSALADKAPPETLMTKLRKFLGTQPKMVSVGGSRSPEQPDKTIPTCLLYPGPVVKIESEQTKSGNNTPFYQVKVIESRPQLIFSSQLNEIALLYKDAKWDMLASDKSPLNNSFSWPLSPFTPEQTIKLAIRTKENSGSEWVVIHLVGATADEFRTIEIEHKQSLHDPNARLLAINKAIDQKQAANAMSLIWADSPKSNSPEISKLQDHLRTQCADIAEFEKP